MSESLRGFEGYGVTFSGKSGDQAYGNCPFCGKENKFYVSTVSSLWDCKVCGRKGNFKIFLSEVYKKSLDDMTEGFLRPLSADRKLPLKALHPWKLGRVGSKYVLPIRDSKGIIQDLRTYIIGQKMKSTIGCNVGLMGLEGLLKATSDTPVYICEGEWDGMALQWLLGFLKLKGIVVAVPGAQIFKREWEVFFQGKEVYCCYDNDEAGKTGELIVQERLTGISKSIHYLHWISELPDGYDVRDVIAENAIKKGKPRFTFNHLIKDYFKTTPRKVAKAAIPEVVITADTPEPEKVTIEEVYKVFGKWLYIKNFGGVEISLATVVSNEMGGDPLWMFLVSSPGGSKTELLQSCNRCSNVYITSSLTSHSLISGAHFTAGKDPSVLPELDKKTLIIKDFTPILTKKETERDEIFGTLRDAYDGSTSKVFGNGQRRSYVCHFSILAGVTPKIYELASEHQSFGERFLKYSLGDNVRHDYEVEMMNRAASNVGSELVMRQEMAEIVMRFMNHQIWQTKQFKPELPEDIKAMLIDLARYGARMRGTVARDRYHSEIMTSKPAAEYGTRLVKQLVKLMLATAYINGRKVINKHDYSLVKKVVIDTIPQRIEDILKCLYLNCPTINDTLKTKEVAFKTKYTIGTISHVLADLEILGVVVKTGKQNIYEWTVSQYIRDLITSAEIYS